MNLRDPLTRSAGAIARVMTGAPDRFLPLARHALARAGLAGPEIERGPNAFDQQHYEGAAGRKFASHDAALLHYLRTGSGRGWEPRPGFSPQGYRLGNPDIAAAGYEPFAHYVRFGRHEGRGSCASADPAHDEALSAPDLASMLQRVAAPRASPRVDVVIPVYGGWPLALRTIDSVLAAESATPHELVVVDDASPDPVLRAELEQLAQRKLLSLIVNERNLGFVQSCNRGMALHPDRDVVLLNSDTCVFDRWLDRLMEALHLEPRTATACPLSNAATILSYPVTLRDNPCAPAEIADIDRLCARLGQAPVEVPTAVGFCMAIKRRCLNEVGPFDAERFGRGYGEENDFCLRASKAGWRHVAAPRVMVWHRGGGSFGPGRGELIATAQATIEGLHPGYRSTVQRFIRSDPLHPARLAIDLARAQSDGRAKVLLVGMEAEPEAEARSGSVILRLVPEIGPFFGKFRLVPLRAPPLPNLPRMAKFAREAAVGDLLMGLGIGVLEVDLGSQVPDRLRATLISAARGAGIEVRQWVGTAAAGRSVAK